MVNPYKCGHCKEFFDCDPHLMEGGDAHRLPVSCKACPYTICHTCFAEWPAMAKGQCPDCDTVDGFDTDEPNISPFACLLLSEAQKKPAAAEKTTVEARPVSQVKPAAVTPPPKEKKRKEPDVDSLQPDGAKARPAAPAKAAKKSTQKTKKRRKSKAREHLEPTKGQKRALKKCKVWMSEKESKSKPEEMDMRKYLSKLAAPAMSDTNVERVMSKVEMLCSGRGIDYPNNWPKETIFMEGVKVDLSMDFDCMHAEATAFEEKHGRDKGNGWLLKHPITKLGNYQRYVIEEELLELKEDDE